MPVSNKNTSTSILRDKYASDLDGSCLESVEKNFSLGATCLWSEQPSCPDSEGG